jgi:hypothetical protein
MENVVNRRNQLNVESSRLKKLLFSTYESPVSGGKIPWVQFRLPARMKIQKA